MPKSEDYLYGALGLERPKAFAARAARERRARLSEHDLENNPSRQTGRTTRMLIEAIASAVAGKQVVVVVSNLVAKRHAADTIRTYLERLGQLDAQPRIKVVTKTHQTIGGAKTLFDHEVLQDL